MCCRRVFHSVSVLSSIPTNVHAQCGVLYIHVYTCSCTPHFGRCYIHVRIYMYMYLLKCGESLLVSVTSQLLSESVYTSKTKCIRHVHVCRCLHTFAIYSEAIILCARQLIMISTCILCLLLIYGYHVKLQILEPTQCHTYIHVHT